MHWVNEAIEAVHIYIIWHYAGYIYIWITWVMAIYKHTW